MLIDVDIFKKKFNLNYNAITKSKIKKMESELAYQLQQQKERMEGNAHELAQVIFPLRKEAVQDSIIDLLRNL